MHLSGAACDSEIRPAVLIVDDESVVVSELVESFESEGYTTYSSTSAAEALRMLRQNHDIAVLISDIRMPDCDGPALLRQSLVDRSEHFALEAIFMTGHATAEEAEFAGSAGGVELIRKPFRLEQLFASVQRALSAAVARREASRGAG